MTTPYTYCITHKPTKKRYYGVRYQRGCEPSDLWNKYFTSSSEVQFLIEQDGISSFEIEIRRTFDTEEQARDWEYRVLSRLKVAQNDNWLNKSNGKTPNCVGTKRSESTKAKLKASWTPERKQAHVKRQTGESNPFFGKSHTAEAVERIREGNRGKTQSLETRKKMSESRKQLIKNNPEYAAQTVAQINTPEAMEKRVKKLRGQKRTPEQRERMRQARLAYIERTK